MVHAGSSVTEEQSEKAQIEAVKRWNGGSILSFINAERCAFSRRKQLHNFLHGPLV